MCVIAKLIWLHRVKSNTFACDGSPTPGAIGLTHSVKELSVQVHEHAVSEVGAEHHAPGAVGDSLALATWM